MSVARKLAAVMVTTAILLGLNQIFEYGVGNFQVNPYYARIINLIGINITLAVSLNLINGRDRVHRRDPDYEPLLDLRDGDPDDRHRPQHRRLDLRARARRGAG